MILKMNNKAKNFYAYMGKFFGSRLVQSETKDRIYDDNTKIWYLNVENSKVYAFLSICNNVIKNIYAINSSSLKELLLHVCEEILIEPSIVTSTYREIYQECGFLEVPLENYKNFVMIRRDI